MENWTGNCLCSGSSIYVSYRLDVTWKLNKSGGSTGNVTEAAFTLIFLPRNALRFSISVLEAYVNLGL